MTKRRKKNNDKRMKNTQKTNTKQANTIDEDEAKYQDNIHFVDQLYKRLGITKNKQEDTKINKDIESSEASSNDNSQELIQCIVCMINTPISNISKLNCNHKIICTTCYRKWIKINHSCPLCRSSIYSEAVLNYNYPLFFPNYNPY